MSTNEYCRLLETAENPGHGSVHFLPEENILNICSEEGGDKTKRPTGREHQKKKDPSGTRGPATNNGARTCVYTAA